MITPRSWVFLVPIACVAALRSPARAQGSPPPGPCQFGPVEFIVPSGVLVGDYTGWACATDGDTLVAGAPRSEDVGEPGWWNEGSAIVYRRVGGVWTFEARLFSPNGEHNDNFGCSLALQGDTLVMGSGSTGSTPIDPSFANSVCVFTRAGSTWTLQAELAPPDLTHLDNHGYALALDGDTLAVGAEADDDDDLGSSLKNTGAVYLWVRSASTWNLQAKLTPPVPKQNGQYFGSSLAIEGDRLVVGARGENNAKGAVYVFERSGSTWSQVGHVALQTASLGAYMGISVGLSGNEIVAGAFIEDFGLGAAYILRRQDGAWIMVQKLSPVFGGYNGRFGRSVAIEGSRLVVGEPDYAFTDGAVYLYEKSEGIWNLEKIVTSQPDSLGGHLGWSATLGGGTVVGGAIFGGVGLDDGGGRLYTYDLGPAPSIYCTAKTNSLGCASPIGYSGCPSASQTTAFRISLAQVRNNVTGLLFYSTGGPNSVPFLGGTLCIAGSIRRTSGQASGGNAAPVVDCSGAFQFEFNDWIASGQDPTLVVGQGVWAQYWSRDPGFSPPDNAHLSDALQFEVLP